MFAGVFRFELRYQIRNPVFWVAVVAFFLLAFGLTTIDQIKLGGGGNFHKNSPFMIALQMLSFSMFYMFVSTAFVANVIVRDDETGFGPIVRATRITRTAYLLGRFSGAWLAAAIGFLAVPLGVFVGSYMPWVDSELLGPNLLSYYVVPYFWIALPDLLLTSALFFALATATRSMMATYLGVVGFLVLYTIVNVVLDRNPAYELIGAYGDPLGFGAFTYATKYWTAADANSLVPPIDGMLLLNRALIVAIALGIMAVATATFRIGDRPSKAGRRALKLQRQTDGDEVAIGSAGPLPQPTFGAATAWAQLRARTRLEMVQVFRSPAFFVLMALGLFNAAIGLVDLSQLFGTPVYAITRVIILLLGQGFTFIPVIIAIYYAGELVWRERDRKMHEIIDASAIPDWAYVVPKALAVVLVLCSTLLISVVAGLLTQLFHGYTDVEFGKYLLWYVLPYTVSFTLIGVLAVFIQALSPNKYVGWGLMVVYYIIIRVTLRNLGFGDALYNYGQTLDVPLSDMNGLGRFWIGAWWMRFYWSAFALILLVLAHALWRRGTETRLIPRLKRLPARLKGPAGVVGAVALTAFFASGGVIFHNTHVLNRYSTALSDDRFMADYEKALLPYEKVPQLSVKAVRVAIDLRPKEPGLTAQGVLTLVNNTAAPIRDVHVRIGDKVTKLISLSQIGRAHV